MARSIIGAALGGHPNWAAPRPVVRPVAPPKPPGIAQAGGAILPAPPKPPSVAAAGGAGLNAGRYLSPAPGSPAGTPAGMQAVTSTVTPPPADLSNGRWLGYLHPDQLDQLNQAGATYNQRAGDAQAQIDNANIDYNTSLANAQYAHDVSQEQAVEEMAARGLSVSGIRDSDLTDINRSLTERQAFASQTLSTLVGEATRAISGLNSSWGSSQILAQSEAAVNAAQLPQQQPYQATSYVPSAPAAPAAGPGNARRGLAGAGLAVLRGAGGLTGGLAGAGSAVSRGAGGLSRSGLASAGTAIPGNRRR